MDTVTQIALGAAVGEAVLGKKAGNKAVLWGAVGGIIPDLDVLVMPFVPEMQALAIHRGFSHSITFAVLFAPLFGWVIYKIHQKSPASRREWSWLVFWSVFTHAILDCFTVYGTQLFQPFSNYPVAWNSVFIIDPVYTLPLLAGVIIILFLRRETSARQWINYATLGFSTFYLLLGVAIKLHVISIFETSLQKQQIPYQRMMSANMPITIFLWMGIAENDETQWVGLYSIFDKDDNIRFREVKKNRELIANYLDQPAIRRLLWFSRGFYTVTEENGALYFNDLRFGGTETWLEEKGKYIFSFQLHIEPGDPPMVSGFHRDAPQFEINQRVLRRLFTRILGEVAPE
jgi:inner membrane protein